MTHLASHTARKHDPLQLFSRALGASCYYRLPLTFSVSLPPRSSRAPNVSSCVRVRALPENNGAFSVFLEPPRKSLLLSCRSPVFRPPPASPSPSLLSPFSFRLRMLLRFSRAIYTAALTVIEILSRYVTSVYQSRSVSRNRTNSSVFLLYYVLSWSTFMLFASFNLLFSNYFLRNSISLLLGVFARVAINRLFLSVYFFPPGRDDFA